MPWAEQGADSGVLRLLLEGLRLIPRQRDHYGAGVPLVLRHREKCDTAEFVTVVENLLHGDGDLHDLLERVRLVRVTAFEQGAVPGHVGEKLTVLLDDPVRVVVPLCPAPPERVSVA
jgi:hypothetical protein